MTARTAPTRLSHRRGALKHLVGWSSLALAACGGGGSSSDVASTPGGSTTGGGTTGGGTTGGGTGSGSGGSGPASLSITTHPQATTVKSGNTATFTVSAAGSGTLTYQWLRNGAAIAGATTASYTTAALTYADNGAIFSVRVADTAGNVTSNGATLTVTPRVVEVQANEYASYALLDNGTMRGWGGSHLLGVGNTVVAAGNAISPMLVDGTLLASIAHLGGGENDMFVVKQDGTVWGWGANGDGELGDGSHTERKNPVQVLTTTGSAFSGVTQVASGTEHAVALKTDGSVWTWGGNNFGQLGNGTFGVDAVAESRTPVQVLTGVGTPLTGVTRIAASGLTSLALRSDGTLWAWGFGPLGNGATAITEEFSAYAVRVETSAGVALGNVVDIACGLLGHHVAVRGDGTVYTWGSNNYGQLGDGTRANNRLRPVQMVNTDGSAFGNVKAAAAGLVFTMLLRNDGTVWSCGANQSGALGIGLDSISAERLNPVQVITTAGTPLTGIASIRTSYSHVIALANDGSIWTWGANGWGQVGDGTSTQRTSAFHITGL